MARLTEEQAEALRGLVFDGGLRPPSTFFFPAPRPRGKVTLPAGVRAAAQPLGVIRAVGPRALIWIFRGSTGVQLQKTWVTRAISGPALIDYLWVTETGTPAVGTLRWAIRWANDSYRPDGSETLGNPVSGTLIHEVLPQLLGLITTPNRNAIPTPLGTQSGSYHQMPIGVLVSADSFFVKITGVNDGAADRTIEGGIRIIENWDPEWQVGG